MFDATALFESTAGSYDAPRRRLVPCFDDFYGTAVAVAAASLAGRAVAAASLAGRPVPRVLDLGAGTGLLAGLLAAAVPAVELTLVDGAPSMLAIAGERLTRQGARHRTVVGDLAEPLPAGPFDAVVSALAIHHLADEAKRDLYARIRAAVVPGGVFVNAEQVAGPTPALDRRYHEVWLAGTRASGATDEDLAGAAERMAYDRPAPVEAQCDWLRTAGFVDVDCFFKSWRFAVFGGWVAAG
jgi:tRNA (cmo5U34)-methyltransferase